MQGMKKGINSKRNNLKRNIMINWKTTLGGILSAAGTYLTNSTSGWLHIVGQVLTMVGLLLLGGMAKDHNVTGS